MSVLDDMAVYVFVRQDLAEQDQRIQIAHAVLMMAMHYQPAQALYRIVELDGGLSEKAFRRTMRKVSEKRIAHAVYADPDHGEWGETAMATIPLTKQQALPLANYRLRRNSPVAQVSESTKDAICASAEMVAGCNTGEPTQGLA